MKVLIIGAAGRIGSVALASCLKNGYNVTAFVRTPSKLPNDVVSHPNVTVFQGDALSKESLVNAIKNQDAVIQAAVYGSDSPFGTSDSEAVVRNIVEAVKEVQSASSSSRLIRLWVVSGQVLLDIPGTNGKIVGDLIPIHPEDYNNLMFLEEHASDLDWSILCPGRITWGKPLGPRVVTVDHVGLWEPPYIIGRIPFIGPYLNLMYNWYHEALTYESCGDFLADHLGPGELNGMRGKRVGLLEDPTAGKKAV